MGLRTQESLGSPCGCLGDEQSVDLLNGESTSLGDDEEHEDTGHGDETSPDECDLGSNLLLDDGGDEGDDGVHTPVGGGGDGGQLGGETSGEDFGGDDPCDRTPSGSETGDEDTGESDQSLTRLRVPRLGGRDGTNDDLSGEHDDGSEDKDVSTTGSVDGEDTREGHDDVDGGQDDDEDVRVVNTSIASEDGTVREVEVDTGDLLTDLDGDTDKSSKSDSVLH